MASALTLPNTAFQAVEGAFAPGTEAMEVLTCTKVTANNQGEITVGMYAGEPKVFFPVNKLTGSELCGFCKSASCFMLYE
ncbi:hypothetical protein P175DRAFT_0309285 [Aspergillus ochraceoroseus IBT 24754]|uniref:Alpha-amylase domain-containing protein n=1 Tax=Aspergillus ochraceoroseus IBT 24754 TaxID=1392256 RepID=A0A2T5LTI9_9EURO|nr:uncharacterized protein P175DRAFT_0309285 [Aspergillus ochraceoroseus IBT 24754]PTU19606.1 hypothetical protein P175DRAFT_0309285 [Aspergillus ochraceoroseus IBT 24754]